MPCVPTQVANASYRVSGSGCGGRCSVSVMAHPSSPAAQHRPPAPQRLLLLEGADDVAGGVDVGGPDVDGPALRGARRGGLDPRAGERFDGLARVRVRRGGLYVGQQAESVWLGGRPVAASYEGVAAG